MQKYEMLSVVGEGSYGVVMKCRHRESGQLVAIKRFLETEEDLQVRKMAFREIRMLKKLHHENLVNMIEVFRRKKRFYLVFEYLDHTLLDELDQVKHGLGWELSKQHVFQVLRGLDFCHSYNVMHRDIKPENILVSPYGIVKLCDFGFARIVNSPDESCTDYVATRWYRAPELLIGDLRYGKAVDVWAVGCLFAEMVVGDPLFPGDSDVDQLYRITQVLGGLCTKHQTIMSKIRPGRVLQHSSADELMGPPQSIVMSIHKLFPTWDAVTVDFLAQCLRMDPELRPKCSVLLQHPFFLQNSFFDTFVGQLEEYITKEVAMNPLINNRYEERKSRMFDYSIGSQAIICHRDTPKWQITLLNDGSSTKKKKNKLKAIESVKPEQTSAVTPNNHSEICFSDLVSVLPNATYIRKPKHKGFIVADENTRALSSLNFKSCFSYAKNYEKNKKIN